LFSQDSGVIQTGDGVELSESAFEKMMDELIESSGWGKQMDLAAC